MKKIRKYTYKGIEYIRLSSLPQPHAEALKKTLNHQTLIKVLHDDVVIADCVLYHAYEAWFADYIPEISEQPKADSFHQLSGVSSHN